MWFGLYYILVQTTFPISHSGRDHLLDHLIMLRHGMPGHLRPLGDGAIIRLVGTEPHVFPDLPLLLGKFLRRWDPTQPIQDCLPLGVQLLDEHFQLRYRWQADSPSHLGPLLA